MRTRRYGNWLGQYVYGTQIDKLIRVLSYVEVREVDMAPVVVSELDDLLVRASLRG